MGNLSVLAIASPGNFSGQARRRSANTPVALFVGRRRDSGARSVGQDGRGWR